MGNRVTPICDNCSGAGKTSLIWKFRDVLNRLTDWDWPKGTEDLRDAIYINVRFNNSLTLHKGVDCQAPEDIDGMLLQRFTTVFSRSLKSDLRPASIKDLIFLVNERCGGQKLLLHLDDVGSYEHYADSINILYRMWHIGEQFRNDGDHYYVLTGRSKHLHTIGTKELSENPTSLQLSSLAELIPLPLLTSISVKAILQDQKKRLPLSLFNDIGEPKEEIIDHISGFTGGVPRAVNAAVLCYLYSKNATPSDVEKFVITNCQGNLLSDIDRGIFYCCLELSWAQIRMTNDETIFNEPITAVMARLGIYRDYHPDQSFTLSIPLFLMRMYNCTSRSLMSIAESENKGQRLEAGFRRILHLRISTGATNWSELGLSILDNFHVTFPEVRLERSYPFPKIIKQNDRTEAQSRECMNQIHQALSPLLHTEFSLDCLPWLCDEMKIGQYYQPLPMSNSADALIRCSDHDLVCFQFKNIQTPFRKTSLLEEIEKCKVQGWNVFMVIVCTKGHSVGDGSDCFETIDGINVVLLSENSVAQFLGPAALKQFSSSSLYADASIRQEVA